MTIIEEAAKHPEKIAKKIVDYSQFVQDAASFFEMDGERLEVICKKHAKNVYETCLRISEMKALEDYYATVIGKIESAHWKKYNEKYSRALSTKDIQAYIAGEPDYVAAKELSLEVAFVRHQLDQVLDALNGMSFMVNNITKLRVAELEDVIL
jgi:hypothetical protein